MAMHPTVKPVALVADALKDCSRRGEIVLDGFAGSGTTVTAAEKSGRRGQATAIGGLIEASPTDLKRDFRPRRGCSACL
jgi:DNA methylase